MLWACAGPDLLEIGAYTSNLPNRLADSSDISARTDFFVLRCGDNIFAFLSCAVRVPASVPRHLLWAPQVITVALLFWEQDIVRPQQVLE